jgi:vanillate O-demethylase monooxygenase subunit
MFVRNAWYVAAWSNEVGRELLSRRICGEPVCFYRTEAGNPVAMIDRCPHRMAPLSLGTLVGDAIQCIYHGITFDACGRCVRIPGQDEVRNAGAARTYPVVDRWGWLWLWMGEPERADPALIPDAHWLSEPGWCAVGGLMHFKGHYQLLTVNLLDLSHEAFTHAATIGNAAVAETPIRVGGTGDAVRVERFMENCPAPPLFQRVCGFATNIDRTQIIEFAPPSFVVIDARAVPTGSASRNGGNGASAGLEWRVLNAITPESESTSHYFWAISRHFAQDDADVSWIVQEQIEKTFREDQVVIEAQQRALEGTSLDRRTVFTSFDAGATRARRIVERLLDAEREKAPAPQTV